MDQDVSSMVDDYPQPSKSSTKWKIALFGALLFLLLSSPWMYKVVNGMLGGTVETADGEGIANWKGMLIHAVVFLIILRLLLWNFE